MGTDDPADPLPYKKLFALYCTLLANSITLTMPFPFLPWMVRDFGIKDPKQVGYYAGLVASSLFFGRSLCAYAWGAQADVIGRKTVLMLSLIGINVFTLMFGFSTSFAVCFVARFMTGLVNGTPQTAKIVVSEICSIANAPKGMALVGTSVGVGMIVGPAVGGLLCRPAERYELLDIPLFRAFPYLLPCLFSCLVSTAATFMVQFYLEETLPKRHKGSINAGSVEAGTGSPDSDRTGESSVALLGNGGGGSGNDPGPERRPATLMEILRRGVIFRVLMLYAFFALPGIGLDEVFPVWTSTPTSLGGLDWDASRIGWSLTASGVALIFGQTKLYDILHQRFGVLGLYRFCAVVAAIATIVQPLGRDFAMSMQASNTNPQPRTVLVETGSNVTAAATDATHLASDPNGQSLFTFIVITLSNTTIKVMFSISFVSIFLFINNSVRVEERGRIQGLAMAFTAVMRAVGPSVGGAIYSWSISGSHIPPFDYHLVFVVFSLAILGVLEIARPLDKSINLPLEDDPSAAPPLGVVAASAANGGGSSHKPKRKKKKQILPT